MRIIRLIATLALIGGVVGALAPHSGAGVAVAQRAAAKHYYIALVTGDNHDPFYVTMNAGAQAEARKLHVTVKWQGPAEFQPQLQIPVLDSVLASKPDFLLCAPTDVKALIAPLQKFKSAHIPIMTVDTDVNKKGVRLGNITSNNALGGKLATRFLAHSLPKGAKVAYVGEQRGVFTTDQRQAGYEAALKHTKLHYVGPQFGADDPNTAASIVSALIARNPDLKGIFASDTAYGQGAATAVQNAGKTGKVKIIAFDAEPGEVSDLKRGLIKALIVQKAYDMGRTAVKDAVAYLTKHKRPPAEWHPSYVIATKANINKPNVKKYLYRQK